ncbi:hypothetical protein V6N12_046593 [Hibiscus sabdariffa]|uniref:Uncharacterized protein n=1 Tax=Hibiscus sabdariffa TaxID=183260 RepID=A0ABR2DK24_9ROSI
MYGSSKFVTQEMTGAIIPALMHRIPSELCCEACLGESSTRMGDLLGSHRVAPLFLVWERPFKDDGCDHTSTNAPDPIRTPQLSVLSKFVTQEMTGAIIPALMHRIPSQLRTLLGAAYKDGVMYGSSKFVAQEMTGAIIPALMYRIPSELRTLVGAAYKDGVMYGSSKFVTQEMTGAIIPALMHRIPSELRIVLRWVTSWEVLVLHPDFWFGNGRFSDIALVGAAYKDGVMYGSSKFVTQEMTGAIIPALMHRIPSELRS